MKMKLAKGVLALVLASAIGWVCIDAWNRTTSAHSPAEPLPGLIAAYSDTSATTNYAWINFLPPRPDDAEEAGQIRFSYRLQGTAPDRTTMSFVLSGKYAEMVTTCEEQSIDIDHGLRFDDLPMSGRLALIALEQRGQQSSEQGFAVQIDRIEAARRASENQIYTRVTIPVAPKVGGSLLGKESIGAEGIHRCGADLSALWSPTSGGYRIMTPPMAMAGPYSSTTDVKMNPIISVQTDDKFFVLRGTHEPKQSGSITSMGVPTNSVSNAEGYENAVASSMSMTYSSTAVQDKERNVTLLIGVLLGAGASIVIAVLSGAFDLFGPLLRRRFGGVR